MDTDRGRTRGLLGRVVCKPEKSAGAESKDQKANGCAIPLVEEETIEADASSCTSWPNIFGPSAGLELLKSHVSISYFLNYTQRVQDRGVLAINF